MELVKYYSRFKILIVIFIAFPLLSCSPQKDKGVHVNLLSIPIKSSKLINHDDFNHQILQLTHHSEKIDNLFFILSKLWFEPYSQNSIISVNKIKDDHLDAYAATLIFDHIPDDDSLSGYRYDIKLKKDLQEIWQITEAKKSWRCWPDRGHTYFSIEPCS